jgi:hypothetical protein
MNKVTFLAAGLMLAAFTTAGSAADHLFTATAAGGLTAPAPGVQPSQPFLNGTNNPGRSGESVPGQGSVLSGEDHSTPATDQPNSGQVKTPPPVVVFTVPRAKTTSIP